MRSFCDFGWQFCYDRETNWSFVCIIFHFCMWPCGDRIYRNIFWNIILQKPFDESDDLVLHHQRDVQSCWEGFWQSGNPRSSHCSSTDEKPKILQRQRGRWLSARQRLSLLYTGCHIYSSLKRKRWLKWLFFFCNFY